MSASSSDCMDGDGFVPAVASASRPKNPPQEARVRADGARHALDYTPPVRKGAFRSADRHSARVKFLKRAIILGSLLAVTGIAVVAVFNPFRNLPGNVSIGGVGVSGTKITMDLPKISGVQQGGGPYLVKARAGVQDITKPTIMELLGVDALVGMADQTTTHIVAENGLYDSRADTMHLSGDVRIANDSGYTLKLQSALVSFKTGMLTSHERLKVEIKGGEVSADDITIANNGHVIAFVGKVSSTFESGDDDSRADTP